LPQKTLYYILFLIYFIVLTYFIITIKFVKDARLNTKVVILLFIVKIAVGIIGGLVSEYLIQNGSDIDYYNKLGLIEYNNLIHHPKIFFTDSLPSAYTNGLGGFFDSTHSFWNDLRNNILIKTMGVFNILSRGNYYINDLFFNCFAFVGHIALYRVFKSIYSKHYFSIIVGCFLLPSFIFYSSLIGKDMLVFTSLSIFCYALYFGILVSFTPKKIAYLIISFCFILLIRNFVAAILLPCAIVYFVQIKFKLNTIKLYGGLLIIFILFFISLSTLLPQYSPLQIIAKKQQSFFSLGKSTSQYQNDTLDNTIKSFVTAAPKALRHSFLSPYIGEFNNIYLNGFALEIMLFVSILLLYFVFPQKNTINAFVIFGLVFTTLFFLFAGYITTNAGSLVRYRSIYFPFLMIPILCSTNWEKLKSIFVKK
jgi:hypothetical protein